MNVFRIFFPRFKFHLCTVYHIVVARFKFHTVVGCFFVFFFGFFDRERRNSICDATNVRAIAHQCSFAERSVQRNRHARRLSDVLDEPLALPSEAINTVALDSRLFSAHFQLTAEPRVETYCRLCVGTLTEFVEIVVLRQLRCATAIVAITSSAHGARTCERHDLPVATRKRQRHPCKLMRSFLRCDFEFLEDTTNEL